MAKKKVAPKAEKVHSKKKYTYERVTFMWNGKRYEEKGKTLKEAIAKAERKKMALESGQVGTSGNMTVSRWADEWLEVYKAPKIGRGSLNNYNVHLKTIKRLIGGKLLKEVKDIDLQMILNQQGMPDEKTGEVKSLDYLSKLRMTMRAMFKRACISKLIPFNPAEYLELPAAKNGTHRSITDKERALILRLAETHYAGLWVKVMLYCRLRPGETLALEWRHIDFDKKLIHVERAMKAHSMTIDIPKTSAGVRDIPIPDKLLTELFVAKRGPFEPVFTKSQSGIRHDRTSMTRMWKNFKRELNILGEAKVYRNQILMPSIADDLVPYCLRHTYGTDLQDAGVPINVAKYLMGHSDISTTGNIYTHTTEAAIKDAADKINKKHAKT